MKRKNVAFDNARYLKTQSAHIRERIAQFVITPVLTPVYEEVAELDETDYL